MDFFAGENCHASEPGWFRACYAWMENEGALDAMVVRIAKHIDGIQPAAAARLMNGQVF